MRKVSISIKALYESCDRRTLYVSIHDAEMPNIYEVPCYAGHSVRDAIQQAFDLTDFYDLPRPNLDNLISEKLYSAEYVAEAIKDVERICDMRKKHRAMKIELGLKNKK